MASPDQADRIIAQDAMDRLSVKGDAPGEYDGLPYFGKQIEFKQEDSEQHLPVLMNATQSYVLDTRKPDDLVLLAHIRKLQHGSTVIIVEEHKIVTADREGWKFLITVAVPYATHPVAGKREEPHKVLEHLKLISRPVSGNKGKR